MKKNNKGITLIALVVTIIVLLILAGVSIITLTGDNGIITRTSSAKKATEEKTELERVQLAVQAARIHGESYSSLKVGDVKYALEKDNITAVEGDAFPLTVTSGLYKFTIDENGNVSKAKLTIKIKDLKIAKSDGTEISENSGKIAKSENPDVYVMFTIDEPTATDIEVKCGETVIAVTNNVCKMQVLSNDTYSFTVKGKINGEDATATPSKTVSVFTNLPTGLAIGEEVTYNPAGAKYTWKGELATTATITTNNNINTTSDDVILDSRPADDKRVEGDRDAGVDRITSWKVLDIDENENVKLVPASQPATLVKLQGANGYNNAVYLLNEACKTLYVNPSLGINAENVWNINVEDIEAAMKDDKISTAKNSYNHNNTSSYGYLDSNDQVKDAYSVSNSYYPLIYAKETKAVINGNSEIGTWNESYQDDKFGRTDATQELQSDGTTKTSKTATNGYVQATTSIKPYQTYYYMSLNASGNEKKAGQSSVLCPSSNNYWVASRCVYANSSICYFNVRSVGSSGLGANGLFYSYRYEYPYSHSLFPVVSLSSELISGNKTSGFKIE